MAMAIELSGVRSQRIKAGYVMISGGEEIRSLIYSLDLIPEEEDVEEGFRFYDALMHNLDAHFRGMADRSIDLSIFNGLKQEESEGARDFRIRVHRHARLCGIGEQDVIIKSRFIDGMRDKLTAQRAYMEDWELDKIVEVASRGEAAVALKPRGWLSTPAQSVEVAEVVETGTTAVGRLKDTPRTGTKAKDQPAASKCYNCGLIRRSKHSCPAKGKKCINCGKMGHFKAVCRGKAKESTNENDSFKTEAVQQVPKRF